MTFNKTVAQETWPVVNISQKGAIRLLSVTSPRSFNSFTIRFGINFSGGIRYQFALLGEERHVHLCLWFALGYCVTMEWLGMKVATSRSLVKDPTHCAITLHGYQNITFHMHQISPFSHLNSLIWKKKLKIKMHVACICLYITIQKHGC